MCNFLFRWYHTIVHINLISVLLNLSLLCFSLAFGWEWGGEILLFLTSDLLMLWFGELGKVSVSEQALAFSVPDGTCLVTAQWSGTNWVEEQGCPFLRIISNHFASATDYFSFWMSLECFYLASTRYEQLIIAGCNYRRDSLTLVESVLNTLFAELKQKNGNCTVTLTLWLTHFFCHSNSDDTEH